MPKKKKDTKKKSGNKSVIPLIPKIPKKKKILTDDLGILEEVFEGDVNLVLFFLCWLKHERNATKAYKELHPNVSDQVASVLGARKLGKVRELGGIDLVLEAYGIGVGTYFKQLKDGIEAMNKIEVKRVGEDGNMITDIIEEPNHTIRRKYHQALGRLLGLEGVDIQINQSQSNQNFNNNQNLIDNIEDHELDDLIS